MIIVNKGTVTSEVHSRRRRQTRRRFCRSADGSRSASASNHQLGSVNNGAVGGINLETMQFTAKSRSVHHIIVSSGVL